MATASKKAQGRSSAKTAPAKKAPRKKSIAKPSSTKRTATKKSATKKAAQKKNKLGVKNSLVNNINAHKKQGDSKSRKKSTVAKKQYGRMEDNWEKDR